MIIKDIAKQGIPEIGNILPLKKNNIIPIKISKTIEIVVVPNFGEVNSHQDNVGIILEEKNVLRILSKRYKNVLITEIFCLAISFIIIMKPIHYSHKS